MDGTVRRRHCAHIGETVKLDRPNGGLIFAAISSIRRRSGALIALYLHGVRVRIAPPSTLDLAIAAVVGSLNALELIAAAPLTTAEAVVASPTSLLLGASVAIRRVAPVASVATFVVAYGAQAQAVGHVDIVTIVAVWVALVASAAVNLPLRRAAVAGLLGLLPIAVFLAARTDRAVTDVGPGELALAGIPWVTGRLLRASRQETASAREQALESERRRAVEAQRAVLEERARIAREMHDIVAHALTAMVVQAEAGAVLIDRDPPAAADAFTAIQRSGRTALSEMRTLLTALRDEHEEDPSQFATLAGLERLTSAAPLEVSLRFTGDADQVPVTIQAAAYRVVQEAITNIAKHSRAQQATVDVDVDGSTLAISVTDPGPAQRGTGDPGFGLIGIRERVERLGGSVQAASAGDGFAVRARLPIGAG